MRRRHLLAAALAIAALASGAAAARAEAPASSAVPSAAAPILSASAPPLPAAPASAAPAASAGAKAAEGAPRAEAGAPVRIHDRKVFSVLVAQAGRTPEQRAAAASQALERAVDEADAGEIRVVEEGGAQVIYAGALPIYQVGPADAAAAGDATLAVHADIVAGKVRDAVRAERQRSAVAQTVFSFALVVFSGLIAFLLLGKLAELLDRTRTWIDENPDRLPLLRVRDIEVVQPAAVRGGLSVALTFAKRLAQIGVVYAWILIALSLFESTRGYTERLSGFVLTPLSALMGRVAVALPLVVIALVTALVVGVAIRFVRLFFGSVARGETTLGWLPRDLAPATSVLVRFGIVLVTLVVAAPLITGADDGAIARAGVVALAALAIASTPLLGTAAAGIAVMYGRRLRVGEHATVGGRSGRVRATTLLEVVLEDEDGCQIYVPHLRSLWHPTRILGNAPPAAVEITVSGTLDLARVVEILEKAAASAGSRPRVEISGLGAEGARLRITVVTPAPRAQNRLFVVLAAALGEHGITLGPGAAPPPGAAS